MSLVWSAFRFDELTTRVFHDMIALRIAVFVVEQNCPYQELDGKDIHSIHIIGRNEHSEIVAIARIVPPSESYKLPSIGRVIIAPNFRSKGIGHELMQEAVRVTSVEYGEADIVLSAQAHLEKFYENHGFQSTGKAYLEDGIPHIEMIKKTKTL
jgi:ElaA protein